MRRAILFLVFALFFWRWSSSQILINKSKKNQKSMFPNKQNRPLLPMIRFQIRVVNQKAIICIDASHGGSDSGYTSDGHTSEKRSKFGYSQKDWGIPFECWLQCSLYKK